MKKFLLTFCVLVVLLTSLFCITASAERTQWMPVTMTEAGYYGDKLFTITQVEFEDAYLLDYSDTPYQKGVSFYIHGYFGSDVNAKDEIDLILYCYDSVGNHIDTEEFTVDNEYGDLYEYGSWQYFEVPDVTAFVEIASKNPGSWSNSLFISNYRNVWAPDGRVLGIPELMLPVYESVGWIGDVELYALDGRMLEVPYPDVWAYKQVGWYEWVDYAILTFRNEYSDALAKKDYGAIMSLADGWLYDLEGTAYAQELYNAKTYAMDAWRKAANAPMASDYNYVYVDSNGTAKINIEFTNVSYKPIKAFKIQFTCYNVFNGVVNAYDYYYVEDTLLNSADSEYYTWKVYNDDVDHISKPVVTQVVYTDGTSWYR